MNSGRRGRRTRRRTGLTAQIARQNSKAITRLAEGQPYEVRCPLNPPPVPTVTTVTRTVEMVVIKGPSGAGAKNKIVYGNAATPCVLYLEVTNSNYPGTTGSNKRYEYGFDFENLAKMLASRFSRSAMTAALPEANIDPRDMFSYLRLDKVCLWGPSGQNQIGFPVQLTVYNVMPTVKTGATMTIAGEYSARSTGDRFRRARVAISNMGGKFIPIGLNFATATSFDLVQFLLGWNLYGAGTNFDASLMTGDVLAVLHITLTGQCGRDVASMLASVDEASSSIEELRINDDCATASSLRSRRRF